MARPASPGGAPPPAGRETPEQELARLRARVRELEVETTKLTTEREILQRGARVFRREDELVSRFQFVADQSDTCEVKRLCELVEVTRSSFDAWRAAAPARAARAAADAQLAARIRAVHDADKTCGAPRITAELNDGAAPGGRVNHKRVARVMREHGIRGYTKRRRARTTIPEPSGHKVPDLLKRDFTADAPNRSYVGDITYLPLADGTNLYLATVIDCPQPAAGRLGGRGPHAHQPCRGRPQRRGRDPRQPGRGDLPLMAIAGWTRTDMLVRYTRAHASERAPEEAARLNLGIL